MAWTPRKVNTPSFLTHNFCHMWWWYASSEPLRTTETYGTVFYKKWNVMSNSMLHALGIPTLFYQKQLMHLFTYDFFSNKQLFFNKKRGMFLRYSESNWNIPSIPYFFIRIDCWMMYASISKTFILLPETKLVCVCMIQ